MVGADVDAEFKPGGVEGIALGEEVTTDTTAGETVGVEVERAVVGVAVGWNVGVISATATDGIKLGDVV